MRTLSKTLFSTVMTFPIFMGICGLAMGAAIGVSWTKSEVIPVVLVNPGIGGFVPVEGMSIGNTWPKSEVKAVILVKPGIGGFEPNEGSSIGNHWTKQETMPVILVQPSTSGFVPVSALSAGGDPASGPPPTLPGETGPSILGESDIRSSPALVESQIDGDNEGWEGTTIVKLTNGQIWQQTEYYYPLLSG